MENLKTLVVNFFGRNFALDSENSKSNTQFSRVFFSRTLPAIFLFFVCVLQMTRTHYCMNAEVRTVFFTELDAKHPKMAKKHYFLHNVTLPL